MVDALASGASVLMDVEVRVLFWAPTHPLNPLFIWHIYAPIVCLCTIYFKSVYRFEYGKLATYLKISLHTAPELMPSAADCICVNANTLIMIPFEGHIRPAHYSDAKQVSCMAAIAPREGHQFLWALALIEPLKVTPVSID